MDKRQLAIEILVGIGASEKNLDALANAFDKAAKSADKLSKDSNTSGYSSEIKELTSAIKELNQNLKETLGNSFNTAIATEAASKAFGLFNKQTSSASENLDNYSSSANNAVASNKSLADSALGLGNAFTGLALSALSITNGLIGLVTGLTTLKKQYIDTNEILSAGFGAELNEKLIFRSLLTFTENRDKIIDSFQKIGTSATSAANSVKEFIAVLTLSPSRDVLDFSTVAAGQIIPRQLREVSLASEVIGSIDASIKASAKDFAKESSIQEIVRSILRFFVEPIQALKDFFKNATQILNPDTLLKTYVKSAEETAAKSFRSGFLNKEQGIKRIEKIVNQFDKEFGGIISGIKIDFQITGKLYNELGQELAAEISKATKSGFDYIIKIAYSTLASSDQILKSKVYHELAHIIELNSYELFKRNVDFIENTLKKINLSGASKEFKNYIIYAQKVYKKAFSTEVLTVGIEMLQRPEFAKEMQRFAPEYVAYIKDTIKAINEGAFGLLDKVKPAENLKSITDSLSLGSIATPSPIVSNFTEKLIDFIKAFKEGLADIISAVYNVIKAIIQDVLGTSAIVTRQKGIEEQIKNVTRKIENLTNESFTPKQFSSESIERAIKLANEDQNKAAQEIVNTIERIGLTQVDIVNATSKKIDDLAKNVSDNLDALNKGLQETLVVSQKIEGKINEVPIKSVDIDAETKKLKEVERKATAPILENIDQKAQQVLVEPRKRLEQIRKMVIALEDRIAKDVYPLSTLEKMILPLEKFKTEVQQLAKNSNLVGRITSIQEGIEQRVAQLFQEQMQRAAELARVQQEAVAAAQLAAAKQQAEFDANLKARLNYEKELRRIQDGLISIYDNLQQPDLNSIQIENLRDLVKIYERSLQEIGGNVETQKGIAFLNKSISQKIEEVAALEEIQRANAAYAENLAKINEELNLIASQVNLIKIRKVDTPQNYLDIARQTLFRLKNLEKQSAELGISISELTEPLFRQIDDAIVFFGAGADIINIAKEEAEAISRQVIDNFSIGNNNFAALKRAIDQANENIRSLASESFFMDKQGAEALKIIENVNKRGILYAEALQNVAKIGEAFVVPLTDEANLRNIELIKQEAENAAQNILQIAREIKSDRTSIEKSLTFIRNSSKKLIDLSNAYIGVIKAKAGFSKEIQRTLIENLQETEKAALNILPKDFKSPEFIGSIAELEELSKPSEEIAELIDKLKRLVINIVQKIKRAFLIIFGKDIKINIKPITQVAEQLESQAENIGSLFDSTNVTKGITNNLSESVQNFYSSFSDTLEKDLNEIIASFKKSIKPSSNFIKEITKNQASRQYSIVKSLEELYSDFINEAKSIIDVSKLAEETKKTFTIYFSGLGGSVKGATKFAKDIGADAFITMPKLKNLEYFENFISFSEFGKFSSEFEAKLDKIVEETVLKIIGLKMQGYTVNLVGYSGGSYVAKRITGVLDELGIQIDKLFTFGEVGTDVKVSYDLPITRFSGIEDLIEKRALFIENANEQYINTIKLNFNHVDFKFNEGFKNLLRSLIAGEDVNLDAAINEIEQFKPRYADKVNQLKKFSNKLSNGLTSFVKNIETTAEVILNSQDAIGLIESIINKFNADLNGILDDLDLTIRFAGDQVSTLRLGTSKFALQIPKEKVINLSSDLFEDIYFELGRVIEAVFASQGTLKSLINSYFENIKTGIQELRKAGFESFANEVEEFTKNYKLTIGNEKVKQLSSIEKTTGFLGFYLKTKLDENKAELLKIYFGEVSELIDLFFASIKEKRSFPKFSKSTAGVSEFIGKNPLVNLNELLLANKDKLINLSRRTGKEVLDRALNLSFDQLKDLGANIDSLIKDGRLMAGNVNTESIRKKIAQGFAVISESIYGDEDFAVLAERMFKNFAAKSTSSNRFSLDKYRDTAINEFTEYNKSLFGLSGISNLNKLSPKIEEIISGIAQRQADLLDPFFADMINGIVEGFIDQKLLIGVEGSLNNIIRALQAGIDDIVVIGNSGGVVANTLIAEGLYAYRKSLIIELSNLQKAAVSSVNDEIQNQILSLTKQIKNISKILFVNLGGLGFISNMNPFKNVLNIYAESDVSFYGAEFTRNTLVSKKIIDHNAYLMNVTTKQIERILDFIRGNVDEAMMQMSSELANIINFVGSLDIENLSTEQIKEMVDGLSETKKIISAFKEGKSLPLIAKELNLEYLDFTKSSRNLIFEVKELFSNLFRAFFGLYEYFDEIVYKTRNAVLTIGNSALKFAQGINKFFVEAGEIISAAFGFNNVEEAIGSLIVKAPKEFDGLFRLLISLLSFENVDIKLMQEFNEILGSIIVKFPILQEVINKFFQGTKIIYEQTEFIKALSVIDLRTAFSLRNTKALQDSINNILDTIPAFKSALEIILGQDINRLIERFFSALIQLEDLKLISIVTAFSPLIQSLGKVAYNMTNIDGLIDDFSSKMGIVGLGAVVAFTLGVNPLIVVLGSLAAAFLLNAENMVKFIDTANNLVSTQKIIDSFIETSEKARESLKLRLGIDIDLSKAEYLQDPGIKAIAVKYEKSGFLEKFFGEKLEKFIYKQTEQLKKKGRQLFADAPIFKSLEKFGISKDINELISGIISNLADFGNNQMNFNWLEQFNSQMNQLRNRAEGIEAQFTAYSKSQEEFSKLVEDFNLKINKLNLNEDLIGEFRGLSSGRAGTVILEQVRDDLRQRLNIAEDIQEIVTKLNSIPLKPEEIDRLLTIQNRLADAGIAPRLFQATNLGEVSLQRMEKVQGKDFLSVLTEELNNYKRAEKAIIEAAESFSQETIDAIDNLKAQTLEKLKDYFREAGKALRKLHDAEIVHFDANLRNLFLRPDNSFSFIDFDNAKLTDDMPRIQKMLARIYDLRRMFLSDNLPARDIYEFLRKDLENGIDTVIDSLEEGYGKKLNFGELSKEVQLAISEVINDLNSETENGLAVLLSQITANSVSVSQFITSNIAKIFSGFGTETKIFLNAVSKVVDDFISGVDRNLVNVFQSLGQAFGNYFGDLSRRVTESFKVINTAMTTKDRVATIQSERIMQVARMQQALADTSELLRANALEEINIIEEVDNAITKYVSLTNVIGDATTKIKPKFDFTFFTQVQEFSGTLSLTENFVSRFKSIAKQYQEEIDRISSLDKRKPVKAIENLKKIFEDSGELSKALEAINSLTSKTIGLLKIDESGVVKSFDYLDRYYKKILDAIRIQDILNQNMTASSFVGRTIFRIAETENELARATQIKFDDKILNLIPNADASSPLYKRREDALRLIQSYYLEVEKLKKSFGDKIDIVSDAIRASRSIDAMKKSLAGLTQELDNIKNTGVLKKLASGLAETLETEADPIKITEAIKTFERNVFNTLNRFSELDNEKALNVAQEFFDQFKKASANFTEIESIYKRGFSKVFNTVKKEIKEENEAIGSIIADISSRQKSFSPEIGLNAIGETSNSIFSFIQRKLKETGKAISNFVGFFVKSIADAIGAINNIFINLVDLIANQFVKAGETATERFIEGLSKGFSDNAFSAADAVRKSMFGLTTAEDIAAGINQINIGDNLKLQSKSIDEFIKAVENLDPAKLNKLAASKFDILKPQFEGFRKFFDSAFEVNFISDPVEIAKIKSSMNEIVSYIKEVLLEAEDQFIILGSNGAESLFQSFAANLKSGQPLDIDLLKNLELNLEKRGAKIFNILSEVKSRFAEINLINLLTLYGSLDDVQDSLRYIIIGVETLTDSFRKLNNTANALKVAEALQIDTSSIVLLDNLLKAANIKNFGQATEYFNAVFAEFTKLEDKINFVSTLFTAQPERIKTVGKEIEGAIFGITRSMNGLVSTSQAADAFYNAFSAFPTFVSDQFNGMRDAAKVTEAALRITAAAGGDASINMRAVAQAMVAYGASSEQAAEFAGKILEIQNQGITTIPEYAQYIGALASQAQFANISLEELGGTLAGLTQVMRTEQAAEGLRGILNQLSSGITPQAKGILESKGIKFDINVVREKGLVPAIQDLFNELGGNVEEFSKIMGDRIATRTALAIVNPTAVRAIQDSMAALGEAGAESLNRAVEVRSQGFIVRLQSIVNRAQAINQEFGSRFANTFQNALIPLEIFVGILENLPNSIKNFLGVLIQSQVVFGNFTAAVISFVGGLTKMVTIFVAIQAVVGIFNQFNTIKFVKELFNARATLESITTAISKVLQFQIVLTGTTKINTAATLANAFAFVQGKLAVTGYNLALFGLVKPMQILIALGKLLNLTLGDFSGSFQRNFGYLVVASTALIAIANILERLIGLSSQFTIAIGGIAILFGKQIFNAVSAATKSLIEFTKFFFELKKTAATAGVLGKALEELFNARAMGLGVEAARASARAVAAGGEPIRAAATEVAGTAARFGVGAATNPIGALAEDIKKSFRDSPAVAANTKAIIANTTAIYKLIATMSGNTASRFGQNLLTASAPQALLPASRLALPKPAIITPPPGSLSIDVTAEAIGALTNESTKATVSTLKLNAATNATSAAMNTAAVATNNFATSTGIAATKIGLLTKTKLALGAALKGTLAFFQLNGLAILAFAGKITLIVGAITALAAILRFFIQDQAKFRQEIENSSKAIQQYQLSLNQINNTPITTDKQLDRLTAGWQSVLEKVYLFINGIPLIGSGLKLLEDISKGIFSIGKNLFDEVLFVITAFDNGLKDLGKGFKQLCDRIYEAVDAIGTWSEYLKLTGITEAINRLKEYGNKINNIIFRDTSGRTPFFQKALEDNLKAVYDLKESYYSLIDDFHQIMEVASLDQISSEQIKIVKNYDTALAQMIESMQNTINQLSNSDFANTPEIQNEISQLNHKLERTKLALEAVRDATNGTSKAIGGFIAEIRNANEELQFLHRVAINDLRENLNRGEITQEQFDIDSLIKEQELAENLLANARKELERIQSDIQVAEENLAKTTNQQQRENLRNELDKLAEQKKEAEENLEAAREGLARAEEAAIKYHSQISPADKIKLEREQQLALYDIQQKLTAGLINREEAEQKRAQVSINSAQAEIKLLEERLAKEHELGEAANNNVINELGSQLVQKRMELLQLQEQITEKIAEISSALKEKQEKEIKQDDFAISRQLASGEIDQTRAESIRLATEYAHTIERIEELNQRKLDLQNQINVSAGDELQTQILLTQIRKLDEAILVEETNANKTSLEIIKQRADIEKEAQENKFKLAESEIRYQTEYLNRLQEEFNLEKEISAQKVSNLELERQRLELFGNGEGTSQEAEIAQKRLYLEQQILVIKQEAEQQELASTQAIEKARLELQEKELNLTIQRLELELKAATEIYEKALQGSDEGTIQRALQQVEIASAALSIAREQVTVLNQQKINQDTIATAQRNSLNITQEIQKAEQERNKNLTLITAKYNELNSALEAQKQAIENQSAAKSLQEKILQKQLEAAQNIARASGKNAEEDRRVLDVKIRIAEVQDEINRLNSQAVIIAAQQALNQEKQQLAVANDELNRAQAAGDKEAIRAARERLEQLKASVAIKEKEVALTKQLARAEQQAASTRNQAEAKSQRDFLKERLDAQAAAMRQVAINTMNFNSQIIQLNRNLKSERSNIFGNQEINNIKEMEQRLNQVNRMLKGTLYGDRIKSPYVFLRAKQSPTLKDDGEIVSIRKEYEFIQKALEARIKFEKEIKIQIEAQNTALQKQANVASQNATIASQAVNFYDVRIQNLEKIIELEGEDSVAGKQAIKEIIELREQQFESRKAQLQYEHEARVAEIRMKQLSLQLEKEELKVKLLDPSIDSSKAKIYKIQIAEREKLSNLLNQEITNSQKIYQESIKGLELDQKISQEKERQRLIQAEQNKAAEQAALVARTREQAEQAVTNRLKVQKEVLDAGLSAMRARNDYARLMQNYYSSLIDLAFMEAEESGNALSKASEIARLREQEHKWRMESLALEQRSREIELKLKMLDIELQIEEMRIKLLSSDLSSTEQQLLLRQIEARGIILNQLGKQLNMLDSINEVERKIANAEFLKRNKQDSERLKNISSNRNRSSDQRIPIDPNSVPWPRFDKGGIVPGGKGQPVPIVAHGREIFLNPNQQSKLAENIMRLATQTVKPNYASNQQANNGVNRDDIQKLVKLATTRGNTYVVSTPNPVYDATEIARQTAKAEVEALGL